ncbi:hypothetical protein [Poriferisphaera sp. WC338]|uniref:hypothetical protein n=1 Tax=Poriferisphaera sp. WC338 TaxID=3425129 RepID=UPI003D818BD2
MVTKIPHKSCKLNWRNSDRSAFRLSLPWVEIDVDVQPEDRPWITKAIDDITHNHHDTSAAQRFLEFFDDHPITYSTPDPEKLATHPIERTFLIPFHRRVDAPSEFLKLALGTCTTDPILPAYFIWDHDDILAQSRFSKSDLHDPTSLISLLIGHRLLTETESEQDRVSLPNKLDKLRELNEARFFQIITLIIRQTWYVATNFLHAITPALTSFPEGREAINHFIQEEVGHDKLMLRSLRALGHPDPTTIPVLEPFTLLIRLFAYSAHYSPAALTYYVSLLEGSSYAASDPIAEIISKSSLPEAAYAYRKHHEINLKHDHKNIVYDIAEKLPLIHRPTAQFALQICETAAHLSVAIDRTLHQITEKAIAHEA